MKKIFTLAIKRILPLLIFICAQAKAWAADTTTTATIHKSTSIFTQPWIWIILLALAIIALLGPFENKNDYPVIRKKKTLNKEKDYTIKYVSDKRNTPKRTA